MYNWFLDIFFRGQSVRLFLVVAFLRVCMPKLKSCGCSGESSSSSSVLPERWAPPSGRYAVAKPRAPTLPSPTLDDDEDEDEDDSGGGGGGGGSEASAKAYFHRWLPLVEAPARRLLPPPAGLVVVVFSSFFVDTLPHVSRENPETVFTGWGQRGGHCVVY